MKVKLVSLAAVILCAAILTVRAADAPKAGRGKLTKPWSDLTSLTDDQKTKLQDIHKKAMEEKKAIEQREHEESVGVLNDDQKKELAKLEGAKGKKKDSATSAPTP
jgi:Spy/CpxP family protein refolding chaperone